MLTSPLQSRWKPRKLVGTVHRLLVSPNQSDGSAGSGLRWI